MKQYVDIEYREVEQKKDYDELINKVIAKCFEVEKLENTKMYISIILTTPSIIKDINSQYRNIDKETDVLSFPMFEKDEIHSVMEEEALGDIVISVERVKQQAEEYGHSFERELAYMLVHGFYHLMGEDHIEEEDKKIMREKEENVLNKLNITRMD
jgi:probable rRNA maturation factor